MNAMKLLVIDCPEGTANSLDVVPMPLAWGQGATPALDGTYNGILLGGKKAQQYAHQLRLLRTHPNTWLLPIFLLNEALAPHPLADGPLPGNLVALLQDFRQRKELLRLDPRANLEDRIFSYLWLLPGRALVPGKDLSDPAIYGYELLALWGLPSPEAWLRLALRNGLLQTDGLVDRLRLCRHCGSPHLNYIDVCPHCGDRDIVEERAIHCFTCGHVSNQERFLRQERLVCPNCLTQLRHIGTDYDRPIETHRCNQCSQMFIDAKVLASCLACDHDNDLEQLRKQELHRYILGQTGDFKAREGRMPESLSLDLGEPLNRAHFLWMLRWLNAAALGGEEQPAVVAGLYFVNRGRLSNERMDGGLQRHVEELALQLRGLLQPTELFCRFDEECVVALFPLDGGGRLQAFSEQLEQLSGAQLDDLLEIRVAGQALPCPDINVDAEVWLEGFVAGLKE